MAFPVGQAPYPSSPTHSPFASARGCGQRAGATFLPVSQELSLRIFFDRGTPARSDPAFGVNVHRDRPKPPVLGAAVSVLIEPPHITAIIDNHVIESVPVGVG